MAMTKFLGKVPRAPPIIDYDHAQSRAPDIAGWNARATRPYFS